MAIELTWAAFFGGLMVVLIFGFIILRRIDKRQKIKDQEALELAIDRQRRLAEPPVSLSMRLPGHTNVFVLEPYRLGLVKAKEYKEGA